MTEKCKRSVFTKPSYLSWIIAWTKCPLICSASSFSRATPCTRTYSRYVCWCLAHQDTSLPALPTSGTPSSWLSTSPESSCQLPRGAFDGGLVMFGGSKMFCLFDVKKFRFVLSQQLRVPSEYWALARYTINLPLCNWRVPGLIGTPLTPWNLVDVRFNPLGPFDVPFSPLGPRWMSPAMAPYDPIRAPLTPRSPYAPST